MSCVQVLKNLANTNSDRIMLQIDTAVGDILLQDIVIRNANPNVLVSDVR